jgi:hypothetical protein
MRRLILAVTVAAFLACVAGVAIAAPESVVLELKGEPGQETKRSTEIACEMDIAVRNPESGEQIFALTPRLNGSLVGVEEVLNVAENGDLTFQHGIESFELDLEVADLSVSVALQGPGGGPPELFKLPPLPIKTVLSKQGKVVAMEGLDKLPIPALPGPGGQKFDLKQMIEGIQTVMDEFGQPRFPDRPVAVGESWGWDMMVDPLEMAEKMGQQIPDEAKPMLSLTKFPVKSTSTLAGFEMVDGVECARIVSETPWELEIPVGPGMTLQEAGDTTVVSLLDYEAGRILNEVFEFSLEIRAGTAEMAMMEMEFAIRGESEVQ